MNQNNDKFPPRPAGCLAARLPEHPEAEAYFSWFGREPCACEKRADGKAGKPDTESDGQNPLTK